MLQYLSTNSTISLLYRYSVLNLIYNVQYVLRFYVERREGEMVFVIVHLELKEHPEEMFHVSWIRVHQNVEDFLLLDFT